MARHVNTHAQLLQLPQHHLCHEGSKHGCHWWVAVAT
jgi:hypothetical protein